MTPRHDLSLFASRNWRKGKQEELENTLVNNKKEKRAACTEYGRPIHEPGVRSLKSWHKTSAQVFQLPADGRCDQETCSRSSRHWPDLEEDSCSGINTAAGSLAWTRFTVQNVASLQACKLSWGEVRDATHPTQQSIFLHKHSPPYLYLIHHLYNPPTKGTFGKVTMVFFQQQNHCETMCTEKLIN